MHNYFPLWLRISHLINIFCLLLLARSGIQILMDHPKLYWKDNSQDGKEWLKFTRKKMPKDKLWTSMDEADTPKNKIIAMPGGHHNLGAARNWHFLMVVIWVVTGFIYVGLLFASGEWRSIIPTNVHIFSRAAATFSSYAHFHLPPTSDFQPFDPLQQLAYFSVVFIAAPIMLLSGLAMSPAFIGRFPGYLKLFGGNKQTARSIHFLGLVYLAIFTVVHVGLVFVVYFGNNIRNIVFGDESGSMTTAIIIASAALLAIVLFNIWATWYTLKRQRRFQKFATFILNPFFRNIFGRLSSKQHYTDKDITDNFRINGYPPTTKTWLKLKQDDFKDWTLQVGGMVTNSLEWSLADLKRLKKQQQITKHNCIQGWTAVGEWGGVPMQKIIEAVKPLPGAKYVVFYGYDADDQGREYYETIELKDARDPLTILAYEFNYNPLPTEHGAPLRLRCERKYGYKMVKYLRAIEFTDSYKKYGDGMGGYREDTQFYDRIAAI